MVHRLRFLVLILAMAASAAIAPSTASPAPAKRALLIGVSSYDRGGPHDWTDLHGEADVTALSTMLQRRFGFAEENIRLLTGPDRTTHDAILNAFREWLIEPTRPGDIIYFHYSGHGTTIPIAVPVPDGVRYDTTVDQ